MGLPNTPIRFSLIQLLRLNAAHYLAGFVARNMRHTRAFLNSAFSVKSGGMRSEKGVIMIFERFKKVVVSLVLSAFVILSAGMASTSGAIAQDRRWDRHDRWERHDRWDRRDREELERIRRLDYQRQLRYRWNNSIRVVGFHDRLGRFHPFGFYDRFGRFHRY